jgi:ferritin
MYKIELAEYHKRKSEKEAEERCAARVHGAPYDKIREAQEELEAISHPNEEQEQLQEVLQTTALKAHGGRTHSRLLARIASHEQDMQSQRKSVFERLGPNRSQNREKRRDHT